eukprot:gene1522-907_t
MFKPSWNTTRRIPVLVVVVVFLFLWAAEVEEIQSKMRRSAGTSYEFVVVFW